MFQFTASDADHMLKSAVVRRLITTPEVLESSHREPPGAHPLLYGLILQRCSNALEQNLVIKRFGQEFDRACSQRLHPHFCVAVCRDEDGWNLAAFGVESGLQ